MGISDSRTARIQTDKVLLLKYCPEGDTGSSPVSSCCHRVFICNFDSIFSLCLMDLNTPTRLSIILRLQMEERL